MRLVDLELALIPTNVSSAVLRTSHRTHVLCGVTLTGEGLRKKS